MQSCFTLQIAPSHSRAGIDAQEQKNSDKPKPPPTEK
jgi:hypothetical protein